MARTGLKLTVFLALLVFVIAPQRAAAQCAGALSALFPAPLELNLEGRTERPADFTMQSAGAGQTCFVAGNSVRVTYNAILTSPTAVTTSTTGNFTITDAMHTMVLNLSTTSGVGSTGPQTVIEIDVITGTTDHLATVTLTNLRFDVTTIAASAAAPTPANANMIAYLSSTVPATTPAPTGIGIVRNTVNYALAGTGITQIGQGTQSAGGPLTTQASLKFATGPGWSNIDPFRVPISTAKSVTMTDIPTGATTITFDVENIPSGVTVTFPATMTVNPGITQVGFTATSGTLSATGGSLQVTYATTTAGAPAATLSIATGAAASDFVAATLATPAVPITIGVTIGSSSANGTANLRVVFGPAEAAQWTGDNASATAIPRYIASDLPGAGANRAIIVAPGPVNPGPGAPLPFFVILPTQSVMLFQYATDLDGYATGLAVTNSGNDSTIFNTKGQTGSITFYLFQTGATTPIIYQVKGSNGRGLDANGNLAPGNVFAISLDELLTDAGQSAGNFSGYVIALCEFNYGHGFDIVFNTNGVGTAVNALYLGSGGRIDVPGVGLSQ